MNLDVKLYSKRVIPLESAQTFIKNILPQVGWNKTSGDEIILDVGCGPGGTTKYLILPLFSNSSKIFGIDAVPDMIDSAKIENPHPQIEYSVANIEDWTSLQHFENKITKLVSISVFHWLKDQRNGFHNVYKLLKHGGEGAFIFPLQSPMFASVLEVQNSHKWKHLFVGVENYVPRSQFEGHDASYYKKLLEDVGFEVLYCKREERTDVFPSEKAYQDFFNSVFVLRKYVPNEQLKEFESDFVEALNKRNGRSTNGMPFHRGHFLELVIRKK